MYSTNRAVYSYVIGENTEGGKEVSVVWEGRRLVWCGREEVSVVWEGEG